MARYNIDSRIEKLVTAIGGLRAGDRVPVRDLADRLGYDMVQLLRDLEPLPYMGAPQVDPTLLLDVFVEGVGEDAVIVVNNDPMMLAKPVRLTSPQSTATIMALLLSGYSYGSPLVQKLIKSCSSDWNETLFERLVSVTTASHDAAVFEIVSLACEKEYGVEFEYTTRSGDSSTRVVEPLKIFHDGGLWYVLGWCHTRRAGRKFRIEAISEPRLRTDVIVRHTLDDIVRESNMSPDELARAISPSDAAEATIRFADGGDYRAFEWPDSGVSRTYTSGAKDVTVPMVNAEWLATKVVGYGGRAVVIAPIELREAVRAVVESIRTADLASPEG